MVPDLLSLASQDEYQVYFEEQYCKKPLITCDGIPVYFAKRKFKHVCFESSNRDGKKDVFSTVRAERLSWVAITLKSESAKLYQGWNKYKRCYEPASRVAFEFEEFVVVVRMSLSSNGTLKGEFITCYQADNSIGKIKKSPMWEKSMCIEKLK